MITGFEPLDILQAIEMLVCQAMNKRSIVEVQYSRVVSASGNQSAKDCVARVFEQTDAEWRGMGMISDSGLQFREEYASYDAIQLLPSQYKHSITIQFVNVDLS